MLLLEYTLHRERRRGLSHHTNIVLQTSSKRSFRSSSYRRISLEEEEPMGDECKPKVVVVTLPKCLAGSGVRIKFSDCATEASVCVQDVCCEAKPAAPAAPAAGATT